MNEANNQQFYTKKVKEYSILRIIAILLVVIGHSAYLKINTALGGVNYVLVSNSRILKIMYGLVNWIYTFHMPLFFMLSGAVYCLSEKKSLDELSKKKFKRLILPFLTYGILFMLPIKRFAGFYENSDFSEVIKSFLNGGESGHLWFLPALFWVSIVFYLILKIFKNRSIMGILVVSFIMQKYYAKYIPIDIVFLTRGISYIFWYALGYCFELWRRKNQFTTIQNIIISILLLMIVGVNNKYNILNNYSVIIVNSLLCFSIASIIANTKIRNMKIIDFLEKYSIYIYLFHAPLEYIVLKYVFKYNIISIKGGVLIYIFARTIGVIVVSLILAIIINQIKYIIKNRENINICKINILIGGK